MKAIIGKKVGMTQVFTEEGKLIPVTVIKGGPMVVTQIKNLETDGYESVQVAFGDVREKLLNNPKKGHLKKAGVGLKRYLKEFKVDDISNYNLSQEIGIDVFAEGDFVDAVATSKGKGFQGPIKRHNQSRGPSSHGSHYHRGPGSMGSASDPSRVFKGKKLAGRMGYERVTIKNLQVVKVDTENNLILVKGSVPGPKKGLVVLKGSKKQA